MKTKKQKFVIVRCPGSGVWIGNLANRSHDEVHLRSARRLWRWRVADGLGIELVAVAKFGLDPAESRVSPPTDVLLIGAREIIPVGGPVARRILSLSNASPS